MFNFPIDKLILLLERIAVALERIADNLEER